MRGQKPKPLRLQKAEGDTKKLGRRKLAEAIAREPKTAPILPDAPIGLNEAEKLDYLTIKQSIEDLGLADHADGRCVELAAIAVSEARRNKSGQALRTALAYLSSLGCGGPTSRARLSIEKEEKPEKELLELLSTPRKPRVKVTERVQ